MKTILLNPGPVTLTERVRSAMAGPDLCHREPEFSELQQSVRSKLLDVYTLPSENWAAVLLTGSGTSAMEAMITSLPGKNDKVLIIENGVYGERLSKIAKIYNINHISLHHDWMQAIDIDRLRQAITSDITHIAVIHHETTSGRLNDLTSIGQLAKEKGIQLLLDGVSSFGAEEICFNEWNIAACAGTANKCLHGVPGTSFVIVNRTQINQSQAIQRSLYLDLHSYLVQQDKMGTPFTQSIQTLYALNAALDEHKEMGGWQARQKAYQERMSAARKGFTALGIRPLYDEKDCSCVLHSYHLPEGINYQTLHDELKQAGFVIYAGQGDFSKTLFRISMMGDITTKDVERLISSIRTILS